MILTISVPFLVLIEGRLIPNKLDLSEHFGEIGLAEEHDDCHLFTAIVLALS